jgi:PAS domain S-box-containing protein
VRSLIASIERTPIATVVTDPRLPDNPIIAANRAFLELTGYAMAEVVGRNCRFLAGEETDPAAQSRLRRAIADGRPAMVEVINYRKDASAFCNAVMVAPILDATGEVMLFVGSQMEIGDQGRAGDRQAHAARGRFSSESCGGTATSRSRPRWASASPRSRCTGPTCWQGWAAPLRPTRSVSESRQAWPRSSRGRPRPA